MGKDQKKKKKQSNMVRILSTPIRVLGKARDMYVHSITKCGYNMNYSNPVDAAGRFTALPRSYSTAATSTRSDSEDYAELMRAASARTLVNRIDMELVLKQQQQQHVGTNGLPKSVSVGMGRIDEDTPYELGGEGDVLVVPDSYPRSRSYAVGKRRVAF